MNKKEIYFVVLSSIMTFTAGWYLNELIHIDGAVNQNVLVKQNQSNDLKNRLNFSPSSISGRFVMKDANYAGFEFINSQLVLWTNEGFPNDRDTLKIRWINDSTFMT